MPKVSHRTKYSIGAFCLLIVFSAATKAQDKKTEAPVKYENDEQLPAAITEASVLVPEPDKAGENAPASAAVRQLRFTAKIVNRSPDPIMHFRLAIENPSALPEQIITIICRVHPLNSNDTFSFSRILPLEMKQSDLMSHLSDFRMKLTGVSNSSDGDQSWKFHSLPDYDGDGMIVYRCRKDRIDAQAQYLDKQNSWTPAENSNPQATSADQVVNSPAIPTGVSTRPIILHHEKAQYTREARNNGIEGIVVLNVIFSADGSITNIRVIRGLPDGLTDKAIEAAKKIRFKPAVRYGVPVSVRGNIEYTFKLH
ncbi:MAG: energy transducer TonB [Blastocatellia bacterium]|nr:energy transducer TonB [Blastocatellia bacterium]